MRLDQEPERESETVTAHVRRIALSRQKGRGSFPEEHASAMRRELRGEGWGRVVVFDAPLFASPRIRVSVTNNGCKTTQDDIEEATPAETEVLQAAAARLTEEADVARGSASPPGAPAAPRGVPSAAPGSDTPAGTSPRRRCLQPRSRPKPRQTPLFPPRPPP